MRSVFEDNPASFPPQVKHHSSARVLGRIIHLNLADTIAICLALIGFFLSVWISKQVFENLPHIEDEMAYVWQAKVIADGNISLPSPPCPQCFLVPFVNDYNGLRFGKYPLAWPVMLSLGIQLGVRHLVNPILTALGLWLTYRLGKKLFGEGIGLLASLLTLTSPVVLMNSATLLSHPFGLFLSLSFTIAWLDTVYHKTGKPMVPLWLTTLTAGLCLGLLALTRPLTALGIAFPFFIHALVLLVKGNWKTRSLILGIGILSAGIASLHFVWQFAVTGDPWLNPYTLWWSYDALGFGPGIGLQDGGYSLDGAYANVLFNLKLGTTDLFGWPRISWLFIPIGLFAIRNKPQAWLVSGVFPSLVLTYAFYWIGAALFGPRYYYEGLFSLTLLSAAGIALLAGIQFKIIANQREDWQLVFHWRPLTVLVLVSILIGMNLIVYSPQRVGKLKELYGVAYRHLAPFLTDSARSRTPALILVHEQETWIEYGRLLELESPELDTPFIFAYDPFPEEEQLLRKEFPGRAFYHYYADTPNTFYIAPRE